MQLHADLSQRAQVHAPDLAWMDSPLPGVQRRMLERDGEEVARATSIVRYAPGSRFDRHEHAFGEEFLVLEGVFSDETGDYGPGYYVRNPPGSGHRPHSEAGCTILVKLRQFDPADDQYVRIDTRRRSWQATTREGPEELPLFSRAGERVALQRWAPGAALPQHSHPGGEELFILDGELRDQLGRYGTGTWLRQPHSSEHAPFSDTGCILYIKTGHLGADGPDAPAHPTNQSS